MKRKVNNLHKLKVTGAGAVNYINNCIANDIKLNNITRTSNREIKFEVGDNDYKKLSKINRHGCEILLVHGGGSKELLRLLICKLGFVIGLIISIILFMLVNNRLLQIHITGLMSISRSSVVDYLDDIGVSRFTYMNYNIKLVENKLAEKFNFSLVSIITKGNSIIISVKEELPSLENSYVAITADYNMVIRSISVYSGTAKVKSGDIVYKGDVIVEPYIISGDSSVFVSPCAEIIAEVYFSNSYVFKNCEETLIKTGKKEIVNSQMNVGKFVVEKNTKETVFNEFVLEDQEVYISTLFLPIFIKKTYAYELEKTVVTRDFNEDKDEIISTQKNKLYSSLPKNFDIDNEDVDIVEIDNGYIINVYMSSIINLRYS